MISQAKIEDFPLPVLSGKEMPLKLAKCMMVSILMDGIYDWEGGHKIIMYINNSPTKQTKVAIAV